MDDDADLRIRRALLKPLARRPQRASDRTAFLEALRRLDDRAISEDLLRQVRDVLSSACGEAHSSNWTEPARAARQVALAKALYASRRIAKHEYVVFAIFPVEAVHDQRWMDGEYQEQLGPISEALRQIEEEHGLGPDEYWPRGEVPAAYNGLNKQYEAVLKTKFIETLKEFGLDDLAALMERSPEEFEYLRERGRRSVFHKNEYIPAIKDVVIQYEKEARKAATAGAYSAAVTSLGAGVEGLLLLRCLRSPKKAGRISKRLPSRLRPRAPDDPSTWTFETLIEVCLAAGWLPSIETSVARYNSAALAHILRRMRNSVHPGRRAREQPWSETGEQEYQDADDIYVILISTLGSIRRGMTQGQTSTEQRE